MSARVFIRRTRETGWELCGKYMRICGATGAVSVYTFRAAAGVRAHVLRFEIVFKSPGSSAALYFYLSMYS